MQPGRPDNEHQEQHHQAQGGSGLRRRHLPALLLCCSSTILVAVENEPVWRLEVDNDYFTGSDNQLTAGWSVQRHSAIAPSWDAARAPDWFTAIGTIVPTLDPAGHDARFGIGIGQLLQTPDDLERRDFIEDDVPYVGLLGAFASWTALSENHVTGLQLYLGVSGEPAFGEEIQSEAHRLIDTQVPRGWDNQVGFEPLVNLTYGQWWKLAGADTAAGWDADLSGGGFLNLGNLRTAIDITIQSRLGWNLPRGFAAIPDPGGLGIAQLPRLEPRDDWSVFLTVGGRAKAIGYTLFLDGSLFDEDEPEAPEREIGVLQALLGLHIVRGNFALRGQAVMSTDPIDSKASNRSWGAITLETGF
ncbi:MAG: lipid A deacylase LpxR family protein [Planctomycetota bacterium]